MKVKQIGTKYDQFSAFTKEEQEEITKQVRHISNMPVPLCS